MPKRNDIKKVIIIGSGPIVIGQAAEFDYAGTQACLALKEEGCEVILCNSNPATIMTDTSIADKIYMEPLTLEYVAEIIRREKPDAILPNIGGQTGLNLAMQLEKRGILSECKVELLGTKIKSIRQAEDREQFKKLCEKLGEPVLQSETASSLERGLEIAERIGYPVVLRPAFTLGGTGGGFAENREEFAGIMKNALELSPVNQVLIEKSVKGYKEIEYEVMRDSNDTAITVCNMENLDPAGIHTGDSIVVCPSQTLTNKEYQMLRDSAIKIIRALEIEGGCNVQFALDPNSFQYYVIEVNPRVSRSSALASKASGYPIARVSAKTGIGMTLDEIPIANTPASFEPALDYVVTKLLRLDCEVDEIVSASSIDKFFVQKIKNIISMERKLKADKNYLKAAKKLGFSDREIAFLLGKTEREIFERRVAEGIMPVYKMIDTCASEFESYIPYFYSTYEEENESVVSSKRKIIVLGSGPIRIGQGIEFDYSSVHAVQTLKKAGYEAIIINNNPETVSTDYTCSDKLYFEPLCTEDVMNIILLERPEGVIVTLGGQTAINLAESLKEHDVKITGTDCDAIERAENRDSFERLLNGLNIPRPKGKAVSSIPEGISAAREIGYPVLVRPSFVLGGRAMQIAAKEEAMWKYLQDAVAIDEDKPILVDKYIKGKEVEVDAVCDGESVFVPGIMELVERTGVHSGDSISVYPPCSLSGKVKEKILDYTKRLGLGIGIKGLFNIQFIVDQSDGVYVIEVNPRSSRTVPFISKSTGCNLADMGTLVMLGVSLKEQGISCSYAKEKTSYYVKVPAFSFSKLSGMDAYLSPEMKSTGEAIGCDEKLHRAVYKAMIASGLSLPNHGAVLVSVADEDKEEAVPLIRRFYEMGFDIEATTLTGEVLQSHGIRVKIRRKPSEGSSEVLDSIRAGHVSYVINTRAILSGIHYGDGIAIRRCAARNNITMLTSLDTVRIVLDVLEEILLVNAG